MAKSAAPFLSIDPSGSIGGILTAAKWKGRNYLRLLVQPSNPRTSGQQDTRYLLGIIAKAAVAVLTSYKDPSAIGSQFFIATRDAAPSGQSWISWLQKTLHSILGTTIETAYDAETGTVRGYFDSAAADAGLVSYSPSWFDQSTLTIATNGGQLYALAYFAANYLTGDVQTAAATAMVGASQGDVDTFAEYVYTNNV